jgi:2'-5' RNA ligase
MQQLNSHQFKEVYEWLGIKVADLGCVMLDVAPVLFKSNEVREVFEDIGNYFYKSENNDRFWIDGFVAQKTPHATLLYGLLQPAENYKRHIDRVLEDWKAEPLKIKEIGFFESPYEDDPYYCIVAHLEVTKNLKEGNDRLQFLPHINTFAGYKPHITIAYIEKDDTYRDEIITSLKFLEGKELEVTGVNLGGNKS